MEKYRKRLYKEWSTYGKIIIGVDFDDTISPWGFRDEEDLLSLKKTVDLLKIAKETGAYIVIFTACNVDRYSEIESYCSKNGLTIDTINKNAIDLPYGNDGKIYANIFLDDRAGLTEALSILEDVMYKIRAEKSTENLTEIA